MKAMGQITGALVGIALVLSAVFVPMAFFARLGRRHLPPVLGDDRVGDGLSVLVALILTPALCATLLKPVAQGPRP